MSTSRLNTKLTTLVDRAIDDVASATTARRRRGIEALCFLIGRVVPEIQTPQRRRGDLTAVPPRLHPPSAPGNPGVHPVPKPCARHVDPKAITRFKKGHRYCATQGEDCEGPLDFSHIKSRAQGGDDLGSNGLLQCRHHHSVWHGSRRTWWRMFWRRLSVEDTRKVLAVFPELWTEERTTAP